MKLGALSTLHPDLCPVPEWQNLQPVAISACKWFSSLSFQPHPRVRASLPNQSACVLWASRRLHFSVCPVEECFGFIEHWTPFWELSSPCTMLVRAWSTWLVISQPLSQWNGISPELLSATTSVYCFYGEEWKRYRISRHSRGVEGGEFGALRNSSLLLADDVVLLSSLSHDFHLALEEAWVCSWV